MAISHESAATATADASRSASAASSACKDAVRCALLSFSCNSSMEAVAADWSCATSVVAPTTAALASVVRRGPEKEPVAALHCTTFRPLDTHVAPIHHTPHPDITRRTEN